MMKHEFEALAGYEVTERDYHDIIEKMYMATDLSKAEFVKCIDKKRFALKPLKTIVKEMKQIASELEESCTHFTDYEKKEKLEKLAQEYADRKYNGLAIAKVCDRMKWSCYYPESIEIFSKTDYKTFENIAL